MATADVPSVPAGTQYGSPPSAKVSLTTWWEKFKKKPATKEGGDKDHPPGIFGVPLSKSIKYANVAISLTNADGEQSIYGYVPIVVAKCGVYLKEKATNVEGIFRLSGSAKRIKDLQNIFNSPDKYGKGLDWTGYTVHDAANIFRRYLNQLPEPIIPLDFYARFREPLQCAPEHFDADAAIQSYQDLIGKLPALNRQLLLYILDLLAVFASKSELNLMNASNLAAIFQPGLINHPEHDMSPGDYKLSQDVLVFLITNQDHFLLGMRGTGESEAIDNLGIPTTSTVPTSPRRSKTVISRSPSNSSAGADDVRKFGNLRRNVSVTSRRSTAGSPALTSGVSGLGRSNTLPSKRSPIALRGDHTPTPSSPRGSLVAEKALARSPSTGGQMRENTAQLFVAPETSEKTARPATQPRSSTPPPRTAPPPLEKDHEGEHADARGGVTTPTKERNFAQFFAGLSPDSHGQIQRPGNKLRKKRITPNHSAESSTTTLPEGANTSHAGNHNPYGPPLTSHSMQSVQSVQSVHSVGPPPTSQSTGALESIPHPPPVLNSTSMLNYFGVSQQGSALSTTSTGSSATLMPAMSPTPSTTSSVTSQSSSHEYSDTTNPSSSPEKKKRSRWRLSNPPISPTFNGNSHGSTASLAERIRQSSRSPPHRTRSVSGEASGMSDGEEKRGAFGWLSKKVQEHRHHRQLSEHENQPEKPHEKRHEGLERARPIKEEMFTEIQKLSMSPPRPGSPRVQPPTPSGGSLPPTPVDENPVSPKGRETNSFWRDRQVNRGGYPPAMHSPRSSEEKEHTRKREGQQTHKRGESQPPLGFESQLPQRQGEVHQPRNQPPRRPEEAYNPNRPIGQLPRRAESHGHHQPPKSESQYVRRPDGQQMQRQEIRQGQRPDIRVPQMQQGQMQQGQGPQQRQFQGGQQPQGQQRPDNRQPQMQPQGYGPQQPQRQDIRQPQMQQGQWPQGQGQGPQQRQPQMQGGQPPQRHMGQQRQEIRQPPIQHQQAQGQGSQQFQRQEMRQPLRQDIRSPQMYEPQRLQGQGTHHPQRQEVQYQQRQDVQHPQREEVQQSHKQETQPPQTQEVQQPQGQEIQQPQKQIIPQPQTQQVQQAQEVQEVQEVQEQQKQEAQQTQNLEIEQPQRQGTPQPPAQEIQQLHKQEVEQVQAQEIEQPPKQEHQQLRRPEIELPQVLQIQKPKFPQSPVAESLKSPMVESQQPRSPETQEVPSPKAYLPMIPDGQNLLRRGSGQARRPETPTTPVSELPLYAPVPGESIEPENQAQGRRRPQAIRPGELVVDISDGPVSPPGTAL